MRKTFLASAQHGFTVPISEEVPVKRRIVASAREAVVRTDPSKSGFAFAVQVAPLTAARRIVTDAQVPLEQLEQFRTTALRSVLAN